MTSPFTHAETSYLLSLFSGSYGAETIAKTKEGQTITLSILKDKLLQMERGLRPPPPSMITWEVTEGGIYAHIPLSMISNCNLALDGDKNIFNHCAERAAKKLGCKEVTVKRIPDEASPMIGCVTNFYKGKGEKKVTTKTEKDPLAFLSNLSPSELEAIKKRLAG